MLSLRRLLALGSLMMLSAGCESAHIKDAYISRDEQGVRRTACMQPKWQSYYLIIELLSFKEDTLLWPYVICVGGPCRDIPGLPPSGTLAPPWAGSNEELVQFGNIAPGKSEGIQAIEFQEVTVDEQGQLKVKDLTPGNYLWQIYLDDEDEPRETLPVDVSDNCPCVGTVIGNCG